jgi:hypothetical protein
MALIDDLTGDDRDAYMAITNLFNTYGLGSLAPKILEMVQAGFGGDTIALSLRETPEYKTRFAGNEARRKAGLPELSPAEYLSVEASYRSILSANGMPPGFYDSPDDFTKWIAGDVSPQEVSQRVAVARDAVYQSDPTTREALRDFYGVADDQLAAYFLDPERATPLLERQYRAAETAGAASRYGLDVSVDRAEEIAGLVNSQEQAAQGYAQVAQVTKDIGKLGDIYGDTFGQSDAEAEVFGLSGAQSAAQKRKKLAGQEQAAFSGSSGMGRDTLTTDRRTY